MFREITFLRAPDWEATERDFRLGTPCTCNRGDGLGQVVLSRLRIEKREKRYNIIRERKNPKVGSIAVLGCDNDPEEAWLLRERTKFARQIFFIVVLGRHSDSPFVFQGKETAFSGS